MKRTEPKSKSQSAPAPELATPPPPPSPHPGFWRAHFRRYHSRNRYSEPESFRDYKNIRVALFCLRKATRMTIEEMSGQIGIPGHMLNMLETRGGIMRLEDCAACERLAADFRLPKLAEFFNREALLNKNRVRPRKERSPFEIDGGGNSGEES